MFECDLTDLGSVIRTLEIAQPDYIFHLASNANVKLSFTTPISVFNNNVNGTLNLLEALRILNQKPMIQFCGTSEVYGQVRPDEIPIKESQSIDPVNVYAISKLTQEKLVKSYYKSYNLIQYKIVHLSVHPRSTTTMLQFHHFLLFINCM